MQQKKPFFKKTPRVIPEINQNIKYKEVMLITEQDTKKTLTSEALLIAQELNLDLVIINKKSEIPIAKIMDYSKYLYLQKRKKKQNKRNSNIVKLKTITIKPQISDHDLQWKADKAIEWLNGNDRVQFLIQVYGRIGAKPELIISLFNKFTKLLETHGSPQANLKRLSKNQYEAFFLPNKSKIQ